MADMTRAEIIERLASRETEFADLDLSDLDLSWIDISGCNFHGCNFSGCDLSGVEASYANMSFCNFAGAVFDKVIAQQINLFGSRRGQAASYINALVIEDTTQIGEQIQ